MVSSFVLNPKSYCAVCQMNGRLVGSITRLNIEFIVDLIDFTISDGLHVKSRAF